MATHEWMDKLKTGEYLSQWNGYEPILIGGAYSENIGIGEEKFQHCIGGFNGIGDVSWWVKAELDNLSKYFKVLLKDVLSYKQYIYTIMRSGIVEKIAEMLEAEPHMVYRLGYKRILEIMKWRHDMIVELLVGTRGSQHERVRLLERDRIGWYVIPFENWQEGERPNGVIAKK